MNLRNVRYRFVQQIDSFVAVVPSVSKTVFCKRRYRSAHFSVDLPFFASDDSAFVRICQRDRSHSSVSA